VEHEEPQNYQVDQLSHSVPASYEEYEEKPSYPYIQPTHIEEDGKSQIIKIIFQKVILLS